MKNIVTNFEIFINENYVFEANKPKKKYVEATEKIAIEIMERQKKFNYGKGAPKDSSSYKLWKQRQDSLDLFKQMTEEEKKKVIESLQERINKSKIDDGRYKAVMGQNSNRKRKNYMYKSPYIIISKDTIETVIPGDDIPGGKIPDTPGRVNIIPEEYRNGLFKDNRWENKVDAYNDEKAFAKIQENLQILKKAINNDLSSKGTYIKEISITSSCSRLRNAEGGLSWYELSNKRAETFVGIISGILNEMDVEPEYKEALRNKTFLYSDGFNGDGTSGPDPLSPYKRGYYGKNDVFNDEANGLLKGKSTLDILISEPGKTPVLKKAIGLDGNVLTKELLNNKTDYKQYQYNDIFIDFNTKPIEPVKGEKLPGETIEPDVIKTDKYEYKLSFKSEKYERDWDWDWDWPNFDWNLGYKLGKIKTKIKDLFTRSRKKKCPAYG
jgi:hypothetical protein